MQVQIAPSQLTGTIHANVSKSAMQRACAAALLKSGISYIHNPGASNDDKAALSIIQQLGAVVEVQPDVIKITSNGVRPVSDTINCGESGLSIRMFTPLAALHNRLITITGSGSLLNRPMDFFDEVLPQLGVFVRTNKGRLPLEVQGPLQPATILVDGSLSSQFLTGLLMAYGALCATGVTLHVKDLKSKPYIDLTLDVMQRFGFNVPVNHHYLSFEFTGSPVLPTDTVHYHVEGDWSGAAFLLVAGALAGPITVTGLDVFSTQADKAILQALMDSGCAISVHTDAIQVGPAPLKPFHFDATECPDLFPPLVALAAACKGRSVIAGTSRLTHKESNRALTLQEEFGKMGIVIELHNDLMIVNGGTGICGADVHSRHDHRIAMACAVAALAANAPVTIDEAEAINKSYPDFYKHLQQLGATVVFA
ncbi:MAG: 3-phosphoshikimate 1-carboxyvinyltransferase [Lacibacter sp.]